MKFVSLVCMFLFTAFCNYAHMTEFSLADHDRVRPEDFEDFDHGHSGPKILKRVSSQSGL
jgi:hypothetical protein